MPERITTKRITITKGIRPVDPHRPQNVVRMLDNSLEALHQEAKATTGADVSDDPRVKRYGEKKAHLEGRI